MNNLPIPCTDYTKIAMVSIVCITLIIGYYLFIEYNVKMLTKKPNSTNKITVRVLAAGFTMAYCIMLLPTSKEALDFQVRGTVIELYSVTKALIFLGAIGFGLITGGTSLSSLVKGKSDE